MERIPKIVLTGGPCAGKTSSEEFLRAGLIERGYEPLFVPEVPTIALKNIDVTRLSPENYIDLQRNMVDWILDMERRHERIARLAEYPRPVLICDRGAVDCMAYMFERDYLEVLDGLETDLIELRDQHYDAVFHLRTAAFGAEEFYTTTNNSSRREINPQAARDADERTLSAWLGHPKLRVIPNETWDTDGNKRRVGLDGKLHNLLEGILFALGHYGKLEIERKYLVPPDFGIDSIPGYVVSFEIEQTYLRPSGEHMNRRVRARRQLDMRGEDYTYTTKRYVEGNLVREEVTEILDEAGYARLIKDADLSYRTVSKIRHVFEYENQIFEFDEVLSPTYINLLEIELSKKDAPILLPPFIDFVRDEDGKIRDVTEEAGYRNRAIAKGECPGY